MLRTHEAGDALATALSVPGLPVATRNDPSLSGFADAGNGIGWKLSVSDEGVGVIGKQMGEPPEYELSVRFGVTFALAGEPGGPRDLVLRAAMQTMAATLFPDGVGITAGGKFDDLSIEGDVQSGHIAPTEQGASPIELVEFTVSLVLTAPTPFG